MPKKLTPIEVPVLVIIFNRPELTKKLIARLKLYKIKNLYVFADGPREDHSGDLKKCYAVREIIKNEIDWKCDLTLNFKEENLGCGYGPAEAITWFFNNVPYGIILEDDIKPSYSFFPYCQELLERYKEEKKVMHITGLNWQNGRRRGKADYYFSRYPGTWGWATWANKWKLFDHNVSGLQNYIKENRIKFITGSRSEQKYHLESFKRVQKEPDHIWDYAWIYSVFKNRGYCIWPNKSLVRNVGFGPNSTHTTSLNDERATHKIMELEFPLKHPNNIKYNDVADRHMARKYFKAKYPMDDILNKLRSLKQKYITNI